MMRRTDFPARGAFTLLECMVTLAVLAVLVVLVAQVCGSAQWIQCQGNRRLDTDEEARAVFDRMAIDFASMVRRPDADFWLKDDVNRRAGDDQMAFFSHVPGYYPEDSWNSPVSVVGYRVDAKAGLRRYSCGLLWNGMERTAKEMFFSGNSTSSNASGGNALGNYWIGQSSDGSEEAAGPEVFRLEYYYVIRARGTQPPFLSEVPWDQNKRQAVDGLCDVAALGVVIALIDAKAKTQLGPGALAGLAAAMEDFSAASHGTPGSLEAQWEGAVRGAQIPPAAASAIRIYRRWFYLPPLNAP